MIGQETELVCEYWGEDPSKDSHICFLDPGEEARGPYSSCGAQHPWSFRLPYHSFKDGDRDPKTVAVTSLTQSHDLVLAVHTSLVPGSGISRLRLMNFFLLKSAKLHFCCWHIKKKNLGTKVNFLNMVENMAYFSNIWPKLGIAMAFLLRQECPTLPLMLII